MKLLKLILFVLALTIFGGGAAFADPTLNVTVDTSSLSGTDGYLYFQYSWFQNATAVSTATVSNFATNGTLGAQDTLDVENGGAVRGVLPAQVAFKNTNSVNDYEHAITFGNSLSFNVSFSVPTPSGEVGGSTFSLGLFGDEAGGSPLLNVNDPINPGTLFTINLFNNGNLSDQILASEATVVPEPSTVLLFGFGLVGLVGMRKRAKN